MSLIYHCALLRKNTDVGKIVLLSGSLLETYPLFSRRPKPFVARLDLRWLNHRT